MTQQTTAPHLQHVAVRDGRIAYVDSGPRDGVPFVLSHSLFFDHTMFAPLTEHLVAAGHRVVAYDHRGQGASDPASLERQSMDEVAEDAAALVEALGLGRVHFLGNSMGGFVALRLAARRPDLLLSAVAAGSSAEEEHQLEAFAPLVAAMRDDGVDALLDTLLHIMFGDATLAAGGPLVDHWRARMATLTTSISESAHQVIHRGRLVEELAGCTVPVLAISGAEDHAYPPPVSDENVAAATGGRWRRVEAAGHSVSLESPDEVAALLADHLATI